MNRSTVRRTHSIHDAGRDTHPRCVRDLPDSHLASDLKSRQARHDRTRPEPRLVEPTPFFAAIVPAKNPVRLCLQDDGQKVLGWVAGTDNYQEPGLRHDRWRQAKLATIHVDKDNTFVWEYKLDKPTKVEFFVDNGFQLSSWLAEPHHHGRPGRRREGAERLLHRRSHRLPADAVAELRRLPPQVERGRRIRADRQRRSRRATRLAAEADQGVQDAKLTSDEHGKITGSYVFSDADALDTYTLKSPATRGRPRCCSASTASRRSG